VETIGTRFGGIPHVLPAPRLPPISLAALWRVLPAALSFALLGGVESLLSAKVADSMTARRHRSNMELVGQGIANIASALFGGIAVTGTIARTATNMRAGGKSPIAGMLHALFLLGFMLVAVCWGMAEKAEFVRLLGERRAAMVLLTTFGLTLVRDLTTGIVAGCVVAAVLALLKAPVSEEGV
jgi:SulP family sulfate permease